MGGVESIFKSFPSANNVRRFGSGIGNLASKAASETSSALGSQTAQTAIKTTGTVAAAVLTNGRSLKTSRRPYRSSSSSLLTVKLGGSKKKEISDKSKTVHDEITPSKKETKHSKKEKTPSKKETKPSKKETTPSKKETKPSKK